MERPAISSGVNPAVSGGLLLAIGFHLLLLISIFINTAVGDAYMDEIFHQPQTQQYCQGRFAEWDPKITTFPGLYLVGFAYANAIDFIQGMLGGSQEASGCSLASLRTVNCVQATACAAVIYKLLHQLHPGQPREDRILWTLALASYPLHFFYTFLYYTDVGALLWVLLAYLFCTRRQYWACSLTSAVAIAFRQTNAVWAAWMLAAAVLDRCFPPAAPPAGGKGGEGASREDAPLPRQLLRSLSCCWESKWQLLSTLWPLVLTPAAFAAFVVANGGVVVGDRTAHQPSRHGMQVAYCAAWVAAALAPVTCAPSRLRRVGASVVRSPLGWLLLAGGLLLLVHRGTMVHPYLLADNRHYTFYLWRRLLGPLSTWLVPCYAYCAWALSDVLAPTRPALWTLVLLACSSLVLVPAWLLELRYFTVPFMLVALHMQPPSRRQVLMLLAAYTAVNAATLYVFAYRPFRWPDGSIARFMW